MALCICCGIVFFGGWRAIDYHSSLLVLLLLSLFFYQFGCILEASSSVPDGWQRRFTMCREIVDGFIAGTLVAVVSFDPLVLMSIILILLLSSLFAHSTFIKFVALGFCTGALLSFLFLPVTTTLNPAPLLLLLLVACGYCLLHTAMVQRSHIKLIAQHESVVQQNEQLKLRVFQLSKYLSPSLRRAIMAGKKVRAGAQEKPLTIFFSDMVDFSKLAEELNSEQLSALLNSYLSEMTEIAFGFGGTVDKVIGDSIMVFFGDPQTRGTATDAIACVSMAVAMKKAMCHLNRRWKANGLDYLPALRMGINSGICKVGNFGTENHLDYTLLGQAVNLASRLESSAKSDEILISRSTYELVKESICCIHVGATMVKGFSEPVEVFSVVDSYKNLNQNPQPKPEKVMA